MDQLEFMFFGKSVLIGLFVNGSNCNRMFIINVFVSVSIGKCCLDIIW